MKPVGINKLQFLSLLLLSSLSRSNWGTIGAAMFLTTNFESNASLLNLIEICSPLIRTIVDQ